MNKRDLEIRRNNTARLVRNSNATSNEKHRRSITIEPGNTWEHELMKFLKGFKLVNAGHRILSEVVFINGKKTDLLDLDTATVYEVTHSESMDSLQRKAASYPKGLTIIAVDSLTGEETLVR